jgi:hypothetical protein
LVLGQNWILCAAQSADPLVYLISSLSMVDSFVQSHQAREKLLPRMDKNGYGNINNASAQIQHK